jgi:hypothetical protein
MFAVVPVIAVLLGAFPSAITNVSASIDCSQSNPDPRCQQVTTSPPQPEPCTPTPDGQCISHHSNATVFCLAGVLLGIWFFPPSAANAPIEAAFCQALP